MRRNDYSCRSTVPAASCRLAVYVVAAVLTAAMPAFGYDPGNVVSATMSVNTPDHMVIDYRFGEFEAKPVTINGQEYSLIGLGREGRNLEAGAPDVPHAARSVIIPNDGQMAAAVTSSSFYDVPDVLVAPSKGNLLRTVNPDDVPYEFGPVYSTDAFYPSELGSLADPYIMRDVRGQVVTVNPIQYNPVTRVLRVYTEMTVEVTKVAPGGLNVLTPMHTEEELSLTFHQIYSTHFLNYTSSPRYVPLNETGNLLIICHDLWLSNVQPLVTHKNSIGINTTAVGVLTIGNNATAIKSYIQSVYNAGNLAFVLLVGDSVQVVTPTASGGSSDPTYSKLAGGDNYPDIIVGRFSAETAAQVDTQVQRTITYETLPATQQTWFKRGMGIASTEGAGIGDEGQADNVHMAEIRTWLLGAGYTTVDGLYGSSATAAQVSSGVNAGRGIINYCGHGSQTSWVTTGFNNTNVAALTNVGMLPFIVSVACVNGQFAGATCFAEAWLRATSGGSPTGAVGMYASSINQSWAPPMEGQDEFNLLLTQLDPNNYFSYGAFCYAGSCSMMDVYGAGDGGGGTNMFNTWHIFGDPSLRIVANPATRLVVTPDLGLSSEGNAGGPFTPGSRGYTLTAQGTAGINYTVAKTQDWVTLSSTGGTLPGGGSTTVTVSINSNANSLPNGTYGDTVTFTNTTNGQGNTTRRVSLKVGVPAVVYRWNLDANPGWTTQGQWAWGTPTGGGGSSGGPDPTSGRTGTKVYGYNLNGDYAIVIPEYHLTTTAINCTNLTQVSLKFWRWLGVERSLYDHAYLRVSNNGTTWTTIWANPDSATADTAWSQQSFNISAIADNKTTVYVRWTMGTTDSTVTYCGWNIDDVEVWGLDSTPVQGACCYDAAPCAIVAQTACTTGGGTYKGNNTTCTLHLCCALMGDMNADSFVDGADIQGFVDAMLAGFAPCADLATPYDTLDEADVTVFVNLLLGN